MHHTRYKDPWRGHVRALEKNIIRYRAIQSVLTMCYTEKLKRDIFCMVPGGSRIGIKKAVKAWVDKGAITQKESIKIRRLIDYRNNLAHEFHKMNADLSTLYDSPIMDDVKQYDYAVIHQLKATINLLYERVQATPQWILKIGLESLDFETVEHVLTSELKTLERRIDRLYDKRREENDQLNREIKEMRKIFSDRLDSPWSLRHENGRLTKTGMALCEVMFSSGYSTLAIAYVMEMSITSARSHLRAFQSRASAGRS